MKNEDAKDVLGKAFSLRGRTYPNYFMASFFM
jgi:hypothetical protein